MRAKICASYACKDAQDIQVNVVALLNDTVGTMMATAHVHKDCRVGVIVGTGTNACYMEKLSKCPKLRHLMRDPNDEVVFSVAQLGCVNPATFQMIVNIEWGAFGDNGVLDFLLNAYDKEVDRLSLNPGQQT